MPKVRNSEYEDSPWRAKHDMGNLRKIDVLMHHANYEGMDFDDAARFIQDNKRRSKQFLVNRLLKQHGYEKLHRVDDGYINSVLATISCHVGERGAVIKGLPLSKEDESWKEQRRMDFFTHLRKTLQLGIAGFVLLALFVKLAD